MNKSWQSVRFGDLGRIFNGNSISEEEKKTHFEGVADGLPYIGTKDVGFDCEVEYETGVRIPDDKRNGLKLAPANTVLVCAEGGSAGRKVAHTDREVFFGNKLFAICPESTIDSRFVFYFCLSEGFKDQFTGAMAGLIGGVSLNKFREFHIALPPLAAQQRIVGILDKAFDAIATAKANAEKNLRNARAIFDSYLEATFSEMGGGWERVTLETLLQRGWIEGHLDGNHGSDYPRKEEFIRSGVPYISANCLEDDYVLMSRAKYLAPNRAALLRKGIAKDGDVLFAHNATVGPVAILRTEEAKVILGTSLTYYRCNLNHILPQYLAHYMRSVPFRSQYLQVMRQSTRNQVPITKQREFWHVIPPLQDQERIVRDLDGLFAGMYRLRPIYEQKVAALDALKTSLLHQAFSGQL